MSKTEPLYLRLPGDLKERVEQYADDVEGSLSSSVAHLVEAGLRNSDELLDSLRDRIMLLESEVTVLRDEGDAARAEMSALREDVNRNRAVISSVLQRLQLSVGTCPTCHEPVTGLHVFVDGACAKKHSLQPSVIMPAARSGLSQSDLLAALAVVGVALGVAAMIAKS